MGMPGLLMRSQMFFVIVLLGHAMNVLGKVLQFGFSGMVLVMGSAFIESRHIYTGRIACTIRTNRTCDYHTIWCKKMRRGGSMKTGWLLLALMPAFLMAQKVERVTVHSKGLEGNLEGDSPDRDVAVYLPKSYTTERARRYPVVYLLHGFTDNVDNWWGVKEHFISVPAVIEKALASGGMREMIVVMPNAFTRYQGSMYSNSVTTGNWERFISTELVEAIDSRYRTIAAAKSRGLAGHSMGGYGAARIGMKYPERFSSIYLLSPCCMAASTPNEKAAKTVEAMQGPDDVAKADFGTKAMMASAAAWSADAKNPPFFFDLPWKNGELQPDVVAKWKENAPLVMMDQYVANWKKLHAIAFDAGAQDAQIAATVKTLDEKLTALGIAHTFEIYEGTHTSRIAERVETKMLPFFSKELSFESLK
jgi:S-formylglutathione hydrolase